MHAELIAGPSKPLPHRQHPYPESSLRTEGTAERKAESIALSVRKSCPQIYDLNDMTTGLAIHHAYLISIPI